MNGNSQRKALWWLANKLKAYAERGEFDDKGWFAYFGGKPPTDESMRQRVLYSPVLMDSYQGLADLQANPLISKP